MDRIQIEKRNTILFIIAYLINNLASGVLYDTYVNYLQVVSPNIATSFWAFYGYATFIAALLLLLIPKAGYKKILILSTVGTTVAFFAGTMLSNEMILNVATALALTGVQLYFIILSPFVATYTKHAGEKGINWYSRAYYMGYIGYFLATYLGGLLVVWVFAGLLKQPYAYASELTRYIEELSAADMSLYLSANKIVLNGTGIISLLSLIPLFMLKEEKSDYEVVDEKKVSLMEKINDASKVLLSKSAIVYLTYWAIISFAMGLFTSYYTVYLNFVLHIDKATASLLVSISYIAIVVFMFFTPMTVKKFGKVGTIFMTLILSIPFMLLIANGDKFGGAMVLVVGVSLFMRAGLANLSSPADSALSMEVVDNQLRPIYTSIVNIVSGLVSIVSGLYTGNYLFNTLDGYRYAYYIAAVLYVIAGVVLWAGLKKFNKSED